MGWPSQQVVDAYVTTRAPAYGIDPSVAVKVRRGESSIGFVNPKGPAYGPYQLKYGGGLGDVFSTKTGLDARNPDTWQAQVDFSLQYASQNGWGSWDAAKAQGIGIWDGIRRAANGVGQILTYYFPVVGYKGNVRETYHTPGAVDLFAPLGTLIRNIVNGRVVSVGSSGPGGNNLLIRGEDGRDYYYAHMLEKPTVDVGDYIPGGATIGKVGKTGNAANTDPHVHIGSGYGISSGTGASGGAGLNFDFQSFLAGILSQGGADGHPIQSIIGSFDPGAITGGIGSGISSGLGAVRQGITNYVQDRAASVVILSIGIFMVIAGIFALAMRSGAVRNVVKFGASKANPIAGVVADAAL